MSNSKKGYLLPGKGLVSAYKDGNLIGTYRTTYVAAEELGLHQQLISKVLTGARNNTGGYTFKR